MKINGWEKINGITYRGCCLVNPIHNADETKYMADILNLNLPQKPKWEFSMLTPNHKFKKDNEFTLQIWVDDVLFAHTDATIEMMKSLSTFRNLYEMLVDEVLKKQDTLQNFHTSPISHSLNVSQGQGIMNVVANTGTTIDYSKVIAELAKIINETDDISDKLKTELNKLIN